MSNFTIRKTVVHCDEDGKMGSKTIGVKFNADTLLFSAVLPVYVAKYNDIACDVTGDTATGVIETYETCCDEYSRQRLLSDVPTQLLVTVYSLIGDFSKGELGLTRGLIHCCGIGAVPVKVLPNGHVMHVRYDGSASEMIGKKNDNTILIDDTPEHRAKVQSLAASIQRAADILAGLRTAANPGEYLMAIREDWQPQPPVQGELPLEPVVNEDDEL
jgi:hypothetical protein